MSSWLANRRDFEYAQPRSKTTITCPSRSAPISDMLYLFLVLSFADFYVTLLESLPSIYTDVVSLDAANAELMGPRWAGHVY